MLESILDKTIRAYKAEVRQISKETGVSKKLAAERIELALERGIDLDYYMDNKLYFLTKAQLKRYTRKPLTPTYVDMVAKENNVTAYEAYLQMIHARDDFRLRFSYFAAHHLFNFTDEQLERERTKLREKRQRIVRSVAKNKNISEEEADQELRRIRSKFGISATFYYVNTLYDKTDEEIAEFMKSKRESKRAMEDKVMEATGWTRKETKAHIAKCNTKYGIEINKYFSTRCYELTDEELATYGNLRDSVFISRVYNRGHQNTLVNKKLFNAAYKKYMGRKYWINRDTTFEEFKEFCEGQKTLFCKPLDASHGRGVRLVEVTDDLPALYEKFMSEPVTIAEELIVQHPEMASFYEGSVNTVRLFSILDNGNFDAFASFVRFGVAGIADNFSVAGGLGCGVDVKTGIINTPAIDQHGNQYTEHPISHKKFEGFQIPHWDLILKAAEEAIHEIDGINYVGWDFAIRDNDVVVVEGNSTPGLGALQAFYAYRKEGVKHIYEKYLPEQ